MGELLTEQIKRNLEEIVPEGVKIEVVEDRQEQAALRFLTGRIGESWRPIMLDDISYIESLQKKTWFYAVGEGYCASHTLKQLLPRLPSQFLQVHRSYIVNIHFIEEISRDLASAYVLTMRDGAQLPVSQSFAAAVRKRLEF